MASKERAAGIIIALQDKAASTRFPEEAAACTAKASALMAKYGVSEYDLLSARRASQPRSRPFYPRNQRRPQPEQPEQRMRRCGDCGQVKPETEWYKGKRQCKACYKKYAKAWREAKAAEEEYQAAKKAREAAARAAA